MRRIGVWLLVVACLTAVTVGTASAEECKSLGVGIDEVLDLFRKVLPLEKNKRWTHRPMPCETKGWKYDNPPLAPEYTMAGFYWGTTLTGQSGHDLYSIRLDIGFGPLTHPKHKKLRDTALALAIVLEEQLTGDPKISPFYLGWRKQLDKETKQFKKGLLIVRKVGVSGEGDDAEYRFFWLIRPERKSDHQAWGEGWGAPPKKK